MARETKRMALYEAIRKGQSKRNGRKKTVRFRPFASGRRAATTRKKEVGYYQRIEDGGAKSKLAALWTPRVTLKLPYPVIVVLFVAAAALFVAAFRFGQLNYDAEWLFLEPVAVREIDTAGLGGSKVPIDSEVVDWIKFGPITDTDNKIEEDSKIEDDTIIVLQGTNAIVIQTYKQRRDLEAVQKHFESNGIKTEIIVRGEYFYLRTKKLYHKCSITRDSFNPDYDGDVAIKEIRRIGAMYKAPQGYESFRPNLFQGAYGEKVN